MPESFPEQPPLSAYAQSFFQALEIDVWIPRDKSEAPLPSEAEQRPSEPPQRAASEKARQAKKPSQHPPNAPELPKADQGVPRLSFLVTAVGPLLWICDAPENERQAQAFARDLNAALGGAMEVGKIISFIWPLPLSAAQDQSEAVAAEALKELLEELATGKLILCAAGALEWTKKCAPHQEIITTAPLTVLRSDPAKKRSLWEALCARPELAGYPSRPSLPAATPD